MFLLIAYSAKHGILFLSVFHTSISAGLTRLPLGKWPLSDKIGATRVFPNGLISLILRPLLRPSRSLSSASAMMVGKRLGVLMLLYVRHSIATPHEEIKTIPTGWRHVGCPFDDDILQLQISLKQQNLSLLDTLLRQVSDPDSSCYGKYLDRDEVDVLFQPSENTGVEVQSWLEGAGISPRDIYANGHYVRFSTSTHNANKLLNTTFLTYTNEEVQTVRAMNYFVPESIKEHVQFISPTVHFTSSAGHKSYRKLASRSIASEHQLSPRSGPLDI